MKYAVITGGWSAEKNENINGAKDVGGSLAKKHEVQEFVFDNAYNGEKNKKIISRIKKFGPDLAFLCTTEELPIQGVLEFLRIKHTGSGVLTTSLSLDKEKCKLLFNLNDIKTPSGLTISRSAFIEKQVDFSSIIFPVVVKPNSSGSSCGVSLVKNNQELVVALKKALSIERRNIKA